MQYPYPLQEKIGHPDLLVGRENEFSLFQKWLDFIPNRLAKSKVILARRKSGKTVFVQRIFNQLWSKNGVVIPFYFDVADANIWLPNLAINYYCAFASQYISFLERDEKLVNSHLSIEQIRKYGRANSIEAFVNDVDLLLQHKEEVGGGELMWQTACQAPHRFAAVYGKRFLVIIDEFQNLSQYVYGEPLYKTKPLDTLPGTFHSLSESKIAPMLVTGSYVGWLLMLISKFFEGGRLKITSFSPYITAEEGLQAVYQYAQFLKKPITNETAVQINELCLYDPFFISCVIQNETGDLTNTEGVIDTVNFEISDRKSEMSQTWNEYLQATLDRVNSKNAKSLLLHLSKHVERYWTPRELKQVLNLDLDINEIQNKLVVLSEADIIDRGVSDIQFRGLQDGTLNLILRNRFEEEIRDFVPDFKQEFQTKIEKLTHKNKQLQGKLNHLSGKLAEHLLATAFRSRKRFALSEFFQGVEDTSRLNIEVKERLILQGDDGKNLELDIVAISSCGRVVLVRKLWQKLGLKLLLIFRKNCQFTKNSFLSKKFCPLFCHWEDLRQRLWHSVKELVRLRELSIINVVHVCEYLEFKVTLNSELKHKIVI